MISFYNAIMFESKWKFLDRSSAMIRLLGKICIETFALLMKLYDPGYPSIRKHPSSSGYLQIAQV